MSKYKPFLYWGQDRENIFIKVDISEIKNKPNVEITDDKLVFEAEGIGVCGRNLYSFVLDFYLPIIPKESKYKNTGRCMQLVLRKEGAGEKWPRLIESTERISWIKIDFDRFAFDSSDESGKEEDDNVSKMNYENLLNSTNDSKEVDFKDDMDLPDYKTCYLFLYNLFQFVGFTYVIVVMTVRMIRDGFDSRAGTYKSVGPQMMFCQLLAFLEIFHAYFGLVKSSLSTTALQVLGRFFVLFILIGCEPKMHNKEVIWGLFVAWSSVEIIRYPYYAFATIRTEFRLLTWLRYSVWIVLYPVGFLFEGLVMIVALPLFEQSGKFNVLLPNRFNFSFQFTAFLKMYMLVMLPGLYFLMQHMLELRKKKKVPTATLR